MKTLLLSLVAILFFTLTNGCKKQNKTSPIEGSWELSSSYGGWGHNMTYNKSNGDIWKFKDSTFENYEKNTLVKSGKFTLESVKLSDNTEGQYLLLDGSEKISIKLSGNKLILFYGAQAYDGIEKVYEKLN